MTTKTLIALIILVISPARAKDLSETNIHYIDVYSKQYIQKHNLLWVKIMLAQAKVESDNGAFKIGALDKSYGLFQVKIETARSMMRIAGMKPIKSDKALRDKLINDDRFSITLASAYLGYLWTLFQDIDLTITAYNSGEGKIIKLLKQRKKLPTIYLNKIKKAMRHK